jgi:hypothetical protein
MFVAIETATNRRITASMASNLGAKHPKCLKD